MAERSSDRPKLGQCLRTLRERACLRQTRLADEMGFGSKCHKPFTSNLEVDRVKNPEFQTVMHFARACGVKWEEFCDLYGPATMER